MVDRNSPIEPNRRVEKIKPLVRGNFYTLNLNSTAFRSRITPKFSIRSHCCKNSVAEADVVGSEPSHDFRETHFGLDDSFGGFGPDGK